MRPILHHYPTSPFAEKIRTLLGFKRIDWSSVTIPMIMPKPDVTALTGGYRKTPILQIGADIYCDTALIARVLERLVPKPTVFPASSAGLAAILAQWADTTLFWTVIPYSMQPAGLAHIFAGMPPEAQKGFMDDRAAFRPGIARMRPAEAIQSMSLYLGELEALLRDGRQWLLGTDTCIADFCVYHCVWFVFRSGPPAALLESYPRVRAWFARVQQFGHGSFDRLDSAEAVKLAAQSKPAPAPADEFVDTHRLAYGSRVTVAAMDYGTEPSAGEFVISSADEIGIRRTDARAGTVIVHFPRIGFEVRKTD
jgi:glutathione S-transferase